MFFDITIAGLIRDVLRPAMKNFEGKVERPESIYIKAVELRRVTMVLFRKEKQHWLPEEKDKARLILIEIDDRTAKIEPAIKLSLRDWWRMSIEEQIEKWTETNDYYILVLKFSEHVKSVTETINRAIALDEDRVPARGPVTDFILRNRHSSPTLTFSNVPFTPISIRPQHIFTGEDGSSRILYFAIDVKDWHSSQLPEQVARLVRRNVRDIRQQVLASVGVGSVGSHQSNSATHAHQSDHLAHSSHEDHDEGEEEHDITDDVSISGSITSDGVSGSLDADLGNLQLEQDFSDGSDQDPETGDDDDSGSN